MTFSPRVGHSTHHEYSKFIACLYLITIHTHIQDMLGRARMVRQVDNKYLACEIPRVGQAPRMVVLIDQHAAHERVRLEAFLENMATGKAWLGREMASECMGFSVEVFLIGWFWGGDFGKRLDFVGNDFGKDIDVAGKFYWKMRICCCCLGP